MKHIQNRKICIVLFFILSIYSELHSENLWKLISINNYPFFSKVIFLDNLNGIALSPYTVFKTIDGGYKWSSVAQLTNPSLIFVSLKIIDTNTYILRSDGIIIKSNLNFNNDSFIDINPKDYYNKFLVINKDKFILLSSAKKEVIITNNGGITWETSNPDNFKNSQFLIDVIFVSNEVGFICSDNGIIYKTTNSGKDWNEILNIGVFIQKLFFINEYNIWFGTGDGQIYYTSDSGNSWENTSLPTNSPVSCIFFINDEKGLVSVSDNSTGTLYSTKDNGKNWILEYKLNQKSTEIQDIFFINDNEGWCVGNSGLILKLDNNNYIIDRINDIFPFPNPAYSTTRVKLQQEGQVAITAVDLLGRSFPIWSGYASTGDMELNVSNLPPGSYTLLIDYGTKREAVRMMKE